MPAPGTTGVAAALLMGGIGSLPVVAVRGASVLVGGLGRVSGRAEGRLGVEAAAAAGRGGAALLGRQVSVQLAALGRVGDRRVRRTHALEQPVRLVAHACLHLLAHAGTLIYCEGTEAHDACRACTCLHMSARLSPAKGSETRDTCTCLQMMLHLSPAATHVHVPPIHF